MIDVKSNNSVIFGEMESPIAKIRIIKDDESPSKVQDENIILFTRSEFQ